MKAFDLGGLALAAAVCLVAAAAAAQSTPTQIGDFKSWEAYIYTEGGHKICYMVSSPTRSKPKDVRRGDVYFMVTHRPAEKVRNEVSIYVGYPYKQGAAADVRIGSQSFILVTEDENAWAPDANSDNRLVKAMIRGSEMVVGGQSERGTKTTDRFSLLGFTAAHKAINKACK